MKWAAWLTLGNSPSCSQSYRPVYVQVKSIIQLPRLGAGSTGESTRDVKGEEEVSSGVLVELQTGQASICSRSFLAQDALAEDEDQAIKPPGRSHAASHLRAPGKSKLASAGPAQIYTISRRHLLIDT